MGSYCGRVSNLNILFLKKKKLRLKTKEGLTMDIIS